MKKRLTKGFAAAAVFLWLSGCATTGTEGSGRVADEDVRQQIKEIHRIVQELKGEVSDLRTALAQRRSGAGRDDVKEISLDDDPFLGDRGAKVAIVEFSDYQCPFCRRFHTESFGRIKQKYIDTRKVMYVVRDFPLDFHQEARPAAVAANCAGKQGAYWAMQTRLFRNSSKLSTVLYDELASEIGLDTSAFRSCRENGKEAAEIERDVAYGKTVGVNGTPHFFVGRVRGNTIVNIQRIAGAQPFTTFERAIEAALKEAP